MKTFIMIFISMITMSSFAGEVTGAGKVVDSVLKRSGLNKERLQIAGLQVKMGEVTGAGRIHVDDLSHIVTKKEVLSVDNIQHVEFVNPSQGKFTGEVKSFIFPEVKVKKKTVLAYIVKK